MCHREQVIRDGWRLSGRDIKLQIAAGRSRVEHSEMLGGMCCAASVVEWWWNDLMAGWCHAMGDGSIYRAGVKDEVVSPASGRDQRCQRRAVGDALGLALPVSALPLVVVPAVLIRWRSPDGTLAAWCSWLPVPPLETTVFIGAAA